MTTLTPYQCGADSFDAGIGHDAHGLKAGHPNIDAWQQGWRDRRVAAQQATYDRLTRPQANLIRTAPTPRANPAGEALSRELIAMVRP